MKVFLPFKQPSEAFLTEVFSEFEDSIFYGNFNDYDKSYDIVNIHWPEALFKWLEPTDEQLLEFEKHLSQWNKYSKIISVMHNEYPHYQNTKNYNRLYKLIYNNSHGIVHLGFYSKRKYSKIYLKSKHVVIKHPLYFNTIPNTISPKEAKEKIKIGLDDKVVLVFGNLRSSAEEEKMLRVFKRLKVKRKRLVVPRMYFHHLSHLNKFSREIVKLYYKLHPHYKFQTSYVPDNEIQNYLQASDLLWIVRTESLNSGNIFLGWTFSKKVLGPRIGNMKEILNKAKAVTYDPNDMGETSEIMKNMLLSDFEELDLNYIKSHDSKLVSREYYNFFKLITT
ncbi:hypothetical protein ACXGQW_10480 [Wenyingzhuangia sp. IMCC45533]